MSAPPFRAERLIERDALGPFLDLYEYQGGKLYRCRFCHLGFAPADAAGSQEKARLHVRTHIGFEA